MFCATLVGAKDVGHQIRFAELDAHDVLPAKLAIRARVAVALTPRSERRRSEIVLQIRAFRSESLQEHSIRCKSDHRQIGRSR